MFSACYVVRQRVLLYKQTFRTSRCQTGKGENDTAEEEPLERTDAGFLHLGRGGLSCNLG